MAVYAQPKPRPKLLDQRDKQRVADAVDRTERLKCRARSGGRCEAEIIVEHGHVGYLRLPPWERCKRHATENHHLIGGIGRKNKGRSILAEHRLDVCRECHREITGKVLVPAVTQEKAERAATARYRRIT